MVTVDGGTGDPDKGRPMPGTPTPAAPTTASPGTSVPRPRDGVPAWVPGLVSVRLPVRARGRRVAGPGTSSRPVPEVIAAPASEPDLELDVDPGPPLDLVPGLFPERQVGDLRVVPTRQLKTTRQIRPARPTRPTRPPRGSQPPGSRRQALAEEPRRSDGTIPAMLRRLQLDDAAWWCVLAGFGSAFAVIAALFPGFLPLAVTFLLVLVGLVLTSPVYLLMDSAIVGALVGVAILLFQRHVQWLPTLELVMIGAIVIGCARRRDRSGVARKIGGVGEADTVLIDLRERLRIRTAMPALPPAWRLEAELRQAGGDRFGGDFVVAANPEPDRLDVVLVDVSGKGRTAGGRALLLQGAFAALLDSVPRDRFLVAANQHVLRHGDDESFATAVHLSLDLVSGRYVVAAAGHPPAAQHHAGSGRWSLKEPEQGPPLGVLPDASYPVVRGRLEPGDSLLLYTDGLVEGEGIDVVRGIDRLLGYAETVLVRAHRDGPMRGAEQIMESVDSTGDDRGLVLLRRF